MKKPIYILGVNESHGATAALLKNGEIIAAASEERFTRIKNQSGFPVRSMLYCLKYAKITTKDLDGVFFGYLHPLSEMTDNRQTSKSYHFLAVFSEYLQMILNLTPRISYLVYKLRKNTYNLFFLKKIKVNHQKKFSHHLKIPTEKINYVDHQSAHAFAAYYANTDKQASSLVITLDGSGDDFCSRIFTVYNDIWKDVSSTLNEFSLGLMYLYVTKYLGMKPNEHEYKVMGLAGYTHKKQSQSVADIFHKVMRVDSLGIYSKIPHTHMQKFIKTNLFGVRFDAIAGGIQLFTENILLKLVSNAVKSTNIENIVLGGGVFMNVKANMLISNLSAVKKIFIMPCSTDESVAIGAAYYGYKTLFNANKNFKMKPLTDVYLGTTYSNTEIVSIVKSAQSKYKNFNFTKMQNPALEIGTLLAKGKIIARFNGRMEYGARALGNRSILSRADNHQVIKEINEKIKSRDFWMPFAPVILKERAKDYIVNPKGLDSPFMMMAFETTQLARKELTAALHPYDFTARPQILSEDQNPEYYALIKEFERITGIGGLLNTSFNIHGQPIVCSPKDAINTFQNSGLSYLAISNYLLIKNI